MICKQNYLTTLYTQVSTCRCMYTGVLLAVRLRRLNVYIQFRALRFVLFTMMTICYMTCCKTVY